jgi:hypothetical protein
VTWSEERPSEEIQIHKFYDESSPLKFFTFLTTEPVGTIIDCDSGGGSVSKHIKDAKLTPILSNLFIHTLSKTRAALKSNPIVLKNLSDNELDELIQEIDNYKNKKIFSKKK